MAAGLDANANDMEDVSGTMRAEEERMRAVSRKEEEQRASKLEKEREADIKGGKEGVDTKFKALEFLLSQSKVSVACGFGRTVRAGVRGERQRKSEVVRW